MTLIDFIINLFKAFKKEEPKKDYVIPGAMNNSLVMMQTAQKLSDAELCELKKQIIDMGNRCITHYVIHTTTRGPTLVYDYNSGDRYWECDYLKAAKTQAIITQWHGFTKQDMIDKGLEPIFYENLIHG